MGAGQVGRAMRDRPVLYRCRGGPLRRLHLDGCEVEEKMMSSASRGHRRLLSPGEIEARLVAIEKAQQFGGHSPSPEALNGARRMLTGEMTKEQAIADILAKYG